MGTIYKSGIEYAGGGGGSSVDVVQTMGQSTTAVMSQKAVTDVVGDIETVLQTLTTGGGV